MSEPKTLNDKVAAVLREQPGRRFTAREVAEELVRRWPEWAEKKRRESKQELGAKELVQQIVAEIGAHRRDLHKMYPYVYTTEERPRHYYWDETPPGSTAEERESAPGEGQSAAASGLREADLYPIFERYVLDELQLWPKRIDEKNTGKSTGGFNQWLFPDYVAMELLFEDWPDSVQKELNELAKNMSGSRARLWSFEVKLRLDRSIARKAFFQAVSNSSWANFGYLVAAEIAGDNGTLDELRMLGSLHGVGLIRLDVTDPSESEILVPARERAEVDWTSLARLAKESKDMRRFLQLVNDSLVLGKRVPERSY